MSSFVCDLIRSYLVGHRQFIHLWTRWHLFANCPWFLWEKWGLTNPPIHNEMSKEVQACADNHICSEFIRARIMSCSENIFCHASHHPPLLHSFCLSSVIFPTSWRDTTVGAELHQHFFSASYCRRLLWWMLGIVLTYGYKRDYLEGSLITGSFNKTVIGSPLGSMTTQIKDS